MKLLRFTAVNMQKAMTDIYDRLGPDALIYTTRHFDGGVEVVAGVAVQSEEKVGFKEEFSPIVQTPVMTMPSVEKGVEQNVIEKLNKQLQEMDENVKKLTSHINSRLFDTHHSMNKDDADKRTVLMYHLDKLNIRGQFSQEFAKDFLENNSNADNINESSIERSLLSYIKTDDKEFIDQRNICALVGPTGIGKTTTIAKLAKRYISRYGSKSLGLITTDLNDVSKKNHLRYYSNLLDVDLEYASDAKELSYALHTLRNKKLILIDTFGASQRDHENVANLLSFLESQGDNVSTYITLPCNAQEQILDEVARAFSNTNLRGCILTKQDESVSIAPAVSISVTYNMPIAYICTGQNINTDIEKAEPEKLLQYIMTESQDKKKSTEINLFKNVERVTQKRQEVIYDRQAVC